MTIAGPPATNTSSKARTPKFISPSTNGVLIDASAHGSTTVIASSATDVSSGSIACGGQTGYPRPAAS